MPIEKALPLDGIPEAPHLSESVSAVRPDIQSQLSFPKDISAATNFFKPQGAESFLPSMSAPTGLEATAIAPPPGLEAGLGMPLTPGAEQMSPLINLIMKMPGGIGLASSFFEFLGSFFGGADMAGMLDSALGGDFLEGLMEGAGEGLSNLNLGLDLDGGGSDSLGNLTGVGDGVDFDPVRSSNALSFNSSEPLDVGGRSLDGSFANSPDLNVNGEGSGFGKPLFEHAGGELNFAPGKSFGENDLLATDPGGGGFASTVGPAQTAPLTTQTLPNHNFNMNSPAQGGGNHDVSRTPGGEAVSGHGAPSGEQATVDGRSSNADHQGAEGDSSQNAANPGGADVPAENASYTVRAGDNLWDIAKNHLGDAGKWGELYKLNEGVIGQNPSLIMPGTELQLPGGDHLASAADYTVKSGDNLWNIATDNLGGGEHWKELFHNNADVVGQNPDLIHPGQHLNVSGAEHGGTLASNHAGTAHGASAAHHNTSSLSHNSHNLHSASHGTSASHHVAHAAPAHHAGAQSGQTPAAHHTAQASDAKALPVELKAQAQSLSNIETYEHGSGT